MSKCAFVFFTWNFFTEWSDFTVLQTNVGKGWQLTADNRTMYCSKHTIHNQNQSLLFNLLVDGVLQVLLQPPDLWVHTHFFVCLQLGTDQKKANKVQYMSIMPQLKMKEWIMLSQWHQVSWHIVIKRSELTLPCQFDTETAFSQWWPITLLPHMWHCYS